MMQDMNVLAVSFYFRIHPRNSFRNTQLGNLDVLTVSLEVCGEIGVHVEDFLVSYRTVNLINLFSMFTLLKSHGCLVVAGTSDAK